VLHDGLFLPLEVIKNVTDRRNLFSKIYRNCDCYFRRPRSNYVIINGLNFVVGRSRCICRYRLTVLAAAGRGVTIEHRSASGPVPSFESRDSSC
jgi:hypothetical protein